jgi:hypothetical protein
MSPEGRCQVQFLAALSGGNPRSLGNVGLVVELVLQHPDRVDELFGCLFSDDEILRMRAGDALEKICAQRPDLLQPYVPGLLDEVSGIRQPSVQWHLAQMLAEVSLTDAQRAQAVSILRCNLVTFDDWILINLTIEAMAKFARQDPTLSPDLVVLLRGCVNDRRKSVAARARKLLSEFDR